MIFEGALSKLKQCLIWLCFPEKYNLQGPPCTELRANVCLWQRFWISMPFLPEGLKMRTKAQSALPPPAGAAPLTQNGPLALRLQNYFTQLLGWEAFFQTNHLFLLPLEILLVGMCFYQTIPTRK